MITEGAGTSCTAGCTGILVTRMDSAFHGAPAVQAARKAGAHFSVTVRMDPKVRVAIAGIGGHAWTPIRYPGVVWDDQLRCWVSAPRSPRWPAPRLPRARPRGHRQGWHREHEWMNLLHATTGPPAIAA